MYPVKLHWSLRKMSLSHTIYFLTKQLWKCLIVWSVLAAMMLPQCDYRVMIYNDYEGVNTGQILRKLAGYVW